MARMNLRLGVGLLFLASLLIILNFAQAESKKLNSNPVHGGGLEEAILTEDPISQVSVLAHGGYSPIEQYGITVKEYQSVIVLQSFEKLMKGEGGFDKKAELSKEEYDFLWKEIEKYGVWDLPESLPLHTDGFLFDLTFLKGGKSHTVRVGNASGTPEKIMSLLDDLSLKTFGLKIFNRKA